MTNYLYISTSVSTSFFELAPLPSDLPPVPPVVALDALQALADPLAAVAPVLTPAAKVTWAAVLSPRLKSADITTPRRVAAFLGQCAFESAGFHLLEDRLGYTAPRLCPVWPSRFPTPSAAEPFAYQPEALAN